MQNRSSLKILGLVVVVLGMFSQGCSQVVTVYWAKAGAGPANLQEDKEKCQALQRAVGGNEERIGKCLEAQGWSPIREEIETPMPEAETEISE